MPIVVPQTGIRAPTATTGPQITISDSMQITVQTMGAVRLGDDWNYPDLCAPFWRVYLHDDNGAALVIQRTVWPLPANHPILIPPWLHFAARPGSGVGQIFIQFTTTGLTAAQIQRYFPRPLDLDPAEDLRRGLSALGAVLATNNPAFSTATGAAMVSRLPSSGTDRFDAGQILNAKVLATTAIARAFAALGPTAAAAVTALLGSLSPVRTLAAAIAADPGADWSAIVLAQHLGCSSDHVTRLFRQQLGATPAQLVGEYRLAAAAKALVATHHDIEAIASAHGFATRFSFTRSFTRRFGVGPATYRQRG